MTTTPITTDQLWDALRDVACTTGRKAHRIVMVHRSDVEKALGLIETSRQQDVKVAKMQTPENRAATEGALFP